MLYGWILIFIICWGYRNYERDSAMSMEQVLRSNKYPTTKKRYVGIELEFLILEKDDKRLQKELIDESLQWNISYGYDGSVRDENFIAQERFTRDRYGVTITREIVNEKERLNGKEIRILVEETDAPAMIDKVCAMLNKHNAKINKTCGMHVHLDMRDRDHEKVFNNFRKLQTLMFSTQPKERHDNEYCIKIPRKVTKPDSRYYGINKLAYDKYKTIEIRLHEGSIDAKAIKMWTGFLIIVSNFTTTLEKDILKVDKLDLPEKMKGYLNERIKRYS